MTPESNKQRRKKKTPISEKKINEEKKNNHCLVTSHKKITCSSIFIKSYNEITIEKKEHLVIYSAKRS